MGRSLCKLGIAFTISLATSLCVQVKLYAQPCPITWGPTLQISNTSSNAFAPKFAVAGHTVHVVYGQPGGDTYYRRSPDDGKTWDSQTVIIPADSGPGPTRVVAYGNNVYTVWKNEMINLAPVYVRRSTDSGATWLSPWLRSHPNDNSMRAV